MAKKKEQFPAVGTIRADDGDVEVEVHISVSDSRGVLDEAELNRILVHILRKSALCLGDAPFSNFGIENTKAAINE